MKKEFTTDVWIDITGRRNQVDGYERSKNQEQKDREKLRYWSNFYQKKNKIAASSCIW